MLFKGDYKFKAQADNELKKLLREQKILKEKFGISPDRHYSVKKQRESTTGNSIWGIYVDIKSNPKKTNPPLNKWIPAKAVKFLKGGITQILR